ncbi:MAG: hypothetical protein JXR75_00220 [Rhodobacteraceae bacterium]|nr:hypothetical protein [Paracoccaceae bacterium]
MTTYPLDRDAWWGALPISSLMLDPVEHVISDMTGKGEPIDDDVAPMLWEGEVTLARMTQAEAAHASAMMDLLRPAGRLFWAYDRRRPAPAADPTGALLGAAVPVIASLPASGRELSLSALPAGYVLTRGDLIGWAYDGGRRALHRVLTSVVTANGAGTTPVFEVSTLIRPGVVLGAAVSLIRPSILARRIPGSVVTGTTRGTITEGFTFRFKQSLGQVA